MVKKKLSGQTIAIVILAILLLLAIGFGGVYSFYTARSNKVSGTIVMANLSIELKADGIVGQTGKTDIFISNGVNVNVVPGQKLKNSKLSVINNSSVPIYLMVVYYLKASILDSQGNVVSDVTDTCTNPVLGLGYQYVNDANEYTQTGAVADVPWVDYVFDASEVEGGENKIYRCLVYTSPIEKEEDKTVIGKDELALHHTMGNTYQQATISMTFQAFAIASASFSFSSGETKANKSREIVKAIYQSQDCVFMKGSIQ